MSGVVRLIWNRLVVPHDATTDFTGLNVIVTGANVGLGFEAAIKFCSLGAKKVILGVRDLNKGQAAKVAIERRTGRKEVVDIWQLDMLSYDSIKQFAIKAYSLDHLDVVVLNAGLLNNKYETSKYGWETTLQVNTLSTILLAMYLLEKLAKGNQSGVSWTPVLEIVSSSMYKSVDQSIYDNDDILAYANDEETYQGQSRYALSKGILLYATQWIADLQGTSYHNVKVVSVCPGACRSQLARSFNWVVQIFVLIFTFLFFRTTEQGARGLVRAVAEGKHGEVWKDGVNESIQPPVSKKRFQEILKRIHIHDALEKDWPDSSHLLGDFPSN